MILDKLTVRLLNAINRWSYRQLLRLSGVKKENAARTKQHDKPYNGFRITEHALLRYIERIQGFDVEAFRYALASESLRRQVGSIAVGRFDVGDLTIVVDGNTIITVYRRRNNGLQNNIRGLSKLRTNDDAT